MKRILIICFLTFFIFGCSTDITEDNYKQFRGLSAEQIFNIAETNLAQGNYGDASKAFEALDTIYPFGKYNRQAQFDVIYAYYMNGDSASALASADRFIQLYPRDPQVDYAYYLKGMANFNQDRGFLSHFIKMDFSRRDMTSLKEAYRDFNTLIITFPNSKYAPDARLHMLYLRNVLATHELQVAQYYLVRRAYVAASNRATEVVRHYQQTPAVPDALVVIVRANRLMHLDKPAQDALKVLQANYPNSQLRQATN